MLMSRNACTIQPGAYTRSWATLLFDGCIHRPHMRASRACFALATEKSVLFFISSQLVHLARHRGKVGKPEQAAACVASGRDWVLRRRRVRVASASGRAHLRRNEGQCKGKAGRPGEACGKRGALPAALHRAQRNMMCANVCLTLLLRARSTRGRRCTGLARTATRSATCGTRGRPYVRPTLTGAPSTVHWPERSLAPACSTQ